MITFRLKLRDYVNVSIKAVALIDIDNTSNPSKTKDSMSTIVCLRWKIYPPDCMLVIQKLLNKFTNASLKGKDQNSVSSRFMDNSVRKTVSMPLSI